MVKLLEKLFAFFGNLAICLAMGFINANISVDATEEQKAAGDCTISMEVEVEDLRREDQLMEAKEMAAEMAEGRKD